MDAIFDVVGTERTLQVAGIRLVGVNVENAKKILVTIRFLAAAWLAFFIIRSILRRLPWTQKDRVAFWTRQTLRLVTAAIVIVGVVSIWFDDPTRLATAIGLVTAALAFASQKVVTAVAGYFVILRGKTFQVGDRIVMGGVRGDAVALSFTQTTIMEMGHPPPSGPDAQGAWVQARQYTGRIVTVSNARIFDEPVYNYSRDFPYIWEELQIALALDADWERVEEVLLEAARRHVETSARLTRDAIQELERRYFLKGVQLDPRVYVRVTSAALEMTVRFVADNRTIREVKDAMSRHVLKALAAAEIPLTLAQVIDIERMPSLILSRDRAVGASANGRR